MYYVAGTTAGCVLKLNDRFFVLFNVVNMKRSLKFRTESEWHNKKHHQPLLLYIRTSQLEMSMSSLKYSVYTRASPVEVTTVI